MSYLGLVSDNRFVQTKIVDEGDNLSQFDLRYDPSDLEIFVNTVKLNPGVDYTATNGINITFTNPTTVGDTIEFVSYSSLYVKDDLNNIDGGSF